MIQRVVQTFCLSVLLLLFTVAVRGTAIAQASSSSGGEDNSDNKGWSWDRILLPNNNDQQDNAVDNSKPIVIANGNVWPPPKSENPDDCLILVTRNQLMWHCPGPSVVTASNTSTIADSVDAEEYERTIIFRRNDKARFLGAFSAPATQRRRLWILASTNNVKDELWELDTITGKIVQTLIIEGSLDGHDAVRVNNRVFVVDTTNGHVVECALPASASPFVETSIEEGGAAIPKRSGYVDIIKRHTGFTRADHINNVAVHSDLLISNLHGKGGLSRKTQIGFGESPTRLTALSRSIPEEVGRELNLKEDGFTSISNVGEMCHGIAFWEDPNLSTSKEKVIKLISLDSKSGSMVSVVVVPPSSGSTFGDREVLWEPDENHPVLTPPKGIQYAYTSGAKVFSKGLAVQGNIAYFAVSFARAPPLRQTVPESLLVAYDLKHKQEVFVRTVRSNGLINQIITQNYLGWKIQLPSELPTEELTYHGIGHKLVNTCNDIIIDEEEEDRRYDTNDDASSPSFCQSVEENSTLCRTNANARSNCCVCDGGKWSKTPMLAGKLDEEATRVKNLKIMASVTFIRANQCVNTDSQTPKHIPLESKKHNMKHDEKKTLLIDHDTTTSSINSDISSSIVKHLCAINIKPIEERLLSSHKLDAAEESYETMVTLFSNVYQKQNGNALLTFEDGKEWQLGDGKLSTPPTIHLVVSTTDSKVYHFPWLASWSPLLEETILKPLGITSWNKVIGMKLINIPADKVGYSATSSLERESAHRLHHLHIPIMTNSDDVFFLTELGSNNNNLQDEDREAEASPEILRIKSNVGEVYEFNNAMKHSIHILGSKSGGGSNSIYMILDWIEDDVDSDGKQIYDLVELQAGHECWVNGGYLHCDRGNNNKRDAALEEEL